MSQPDTTTYEDEKPKDLDFDDSRPSSTTRHRRRSASRSRSPVQRENRSRSRSPAARRSVSPRRMDTDDPAAVRSPSLGGGGGPKWAGVPEGRDQRSPGAYDPKKAASREVAAAEAAKRSKKECRVYVGNLSFGTKWNDLKDFMREAGTVVFAEIMMLPNGMSKGCGVVEYSTPEEAQKAIRELSDQTLLGRPLFIREDRENDARYGAAAVAGRAGYMGPGANFPPGGGRGGFGGGFGGRGGFGAPGQFAGHGQAGNGRHLFVQGLPFTCGWQDVKDLFRAAGSIIRADVKMNPDGSPTGTGTVVYETAQDAQNAIAMYNGFEFFGNILEVREDRFQPGGGGRGGFGGGFPPRGGFGGGFGRGGFAGGRGGFGGGFPGAFPHMGFGGPVDMGYGADFGAAAGFQQPGFGANQFAPRGPYGAGAAAIAAPSTQILVKNLPWSTSDEDLVDLFVTTGNVLNAEVLFEAGRSKGVGVVEFATVEEAETAIAKFQSYSYGGRPLLLEFNSAFHTFSAAPPAAPAQE